MKLSELLLEVSSRWLDELVHLLMSNSTSQREREKLDNLIADHLAGVDIVETQEALKKHAKFLKYKQDYEDEEEGGWSVPWDEWFSQWKSLNKMHLPGLHDDMGK